MRSPAQELLALPVRGGRRRGAGRKPAGERAKNPHVARARLRPGEPIHVTLRMADHVWNLRSERSFRIIDAAVRGVRRVPGFRIVHFSVQGNHLHLIAEALGAANLESGMRAFTIRLALGLNRMMGRKGPVLADRYHAHVLRTPAEVRNALRYVIGNFESHAARRGERVSSKGWIDPFSSAAQKAPLESQRTLFDEPSTSGARGWLLRQAERGGAVASREVASGRSPSGRRPHAPTQSSIDGCAERRTSGAVERGRDRRSAIGSPPTRVEDPGVG